MAMNPAFRREPSTAPLHLPLLGMIILIIVLFVISLVAPPVVAAPAQNANIARTYYQLAGQYLQSGMKLKAREEFQRAADLDTSFLEAQLQTAVLLTGEKRAPEAIVYYERALALRRDRADVQLAVAELYAQVGDTASAMRHYQECLRVSPDHPLATMGLARYALRNKDYAEVVSLLENSRTLKDDKGALTMRAYACHQLGRLGEAAQLYRRALQLDANDGEVRLNLGILEAARGRNAEAATELEMATTLLKNPAIAYRYLGLVQIAMNRDDLAVTSFARATNLDARDMISHYQMAKALFRLGRFTEAIREFEIVRAAGAVSRDIPSMLGHALLMTGDYAAACRLLETAVADEPGNSDIIADLAEAYRRSGRQENARRFYERLLVLRPQEPMIYRVLADLYAESGQTVKALEYERRGQEIALRVGLEQALATDRQAWQKKIDEIQAEAQRQVAAARQESDSRVKEVEAEAQRKVAQLRGVVDNRISEVESAAAAEIRRVRAESDSRVLLIEALSRKKIEEMRASLQRAPAPGGDTAIVGGLRGEIEGQLLQAYDAQTRAVLEQTQAELNAARERLGLLESENGRLRRALAAETGLPSAPLLAELERKLADAERTVATYRQKIGGLERRLIELQGQAGDVRLLDEAKRELQLARETARRDSAAAAARLLDCERRLAEAGRELALAREAAQRDSLAAAARLAEIEDRVRQTLAEGDALRQKLAAVTALVEKERALAQEAGARADRARIEADSYVSECRAIFAAVSKEVECGLQEIGADTSPQAGRTVPDRLRFYLQTVRLAADARVARIQLEAEGRLSEIQKRTDAEIARILKDAQAQIDRARFQAAEEVRRAQHAADSEVLRRVTQEREKIAAEALAKRLAMAERLRAEIEAEAQVRFLEEKAGIEASYEADRIRMQREYDQQLAKLQAEYQQRIAAAQLEAKRANDQLDAMTRNDTALLARSDLYQRVVRENAVMREDLAGLRRRLEQLAQEREQLNIEAAKLRTELANVQARLGAVEEEARRYRGVGILTEPLQRGVNINTATLEELQVLPGVGVQEARNIIWYRENVAQFRDTEELSKVPGLDALKAKAIRGLVRVR